jgi:hypothetical protein
MKDEGGRMSEVVSEQSSVVSGCDEDPLADARCLTCGYLLRGLTETRCPECGTAFDPALYAATFVPKWPALMIWYLAAYLISLLAHAGGVVWWIMSPPGKGAPAVAPANIHYGIDLTFCLGAVLTPVFAVVAILGLRRRLDWGRKACIAMQFVQPAAWLAVFWLVQKGYATASFAGKNWVTDWSIPNLLFTSAGPPLIMICLLCTGLRPRSLSRNPGSPQTALSFGRHHPRDDWPLVMSVLLAICALGHLHGLGDTIVLATRHRMWSIWAHEPAMIGGFSLGLITATCHAVAAVKVWRHPARARRTLLVVAGILLAVIFLNMAVIITTGMKMFGFTPLTVLSTFAHTVPTILPVAAMLLFLRSDPSTEFQFGPPRSPCRDQSDQP